MKLFIGILFCVGISIATSFFIPDYNPDKEMITALYTVVGIMFSIGMSLCVTSSTSGVKNPDIKKAIRRTIRIVRNKFIICFAIASAIYIAKGILLFETINLHNNIYFKYDHLVVLISLYSVLYLILNFISIQNLNLEIEDAINTEYIEKNKNQ